MLIVHSHNNVPVRLTDERWEHISRQHPEMKGKRELVLEAVSAPGIIQEGDSGELLALKQFDLPTMPSSYLVVVYREINKEDGFVLTAYFTRRPSPRRKTVWKQ